MSRIERAISTALALVTSAHVALLTWVFARRVSWPLDLEWMEGGSLSHALRVAQGLSIYTPPSLDFIPFPYTPLHPWLLAALSTGVDLSYGLGRSVSIACFVALLVVVFRAVLFEHGSRLWAFVACGTACAGFPLVSGFYDLVRPDSLSLLLIASGLVLLRRFHSSRAGVVASALLLALGFLAKQTAAPFIVAGALALAVLDRRKLPVYVLTIGIVDGGATLWLNSATNGWFWTTIFELHQSHDFYLARFLYETHVRLLVVAPLLVGLPVLWLALAVRSRRFPIGEVYWLFMTAVAVQTSALAWSTQWATTNAFVPAWIFLSLFLGIGGHALTRGAARPPWRWWGSAVTLAAAIQLVALRWDPSPHVPSPADHARAEQLLNLLFTVSRSGPLLIPYHPWYPALVGQATNLHHIGLKDFDRAGRHPPRDLHAALREGRFAAVILDEPPAPFYGPAIRSYQVETIDAARSPWTFEGFRIRPRLILRPQHVPSRPGADAQSEASG